MRRISWKPWMDKHNVTYAKGDRVFAFLDKDADLIHAAGQSEAFVYATLQRPEYQDMDVVIIEDAKLWKSRL